MFKTLDIQLKNMKKEQELRNKLRRLRKTIYEEDMGLNPYSGSFKVNQNRENSFSANKIGLNITNSSTTPNFRSKLQRTDIDATPKFTPKAQRTQNSATPFNKWGLHGTTTEGRQRINDVATPQFTPKAQRNQNATMLDNKWGYQGVTKEGQQRINDDVTPKFI